MDMKEIRANIEAQLAADVELFVRGFVMIEDKDAPELIVPFNLWPEQKRVLKSIHENRLNILLKSRQLGFTWLSLAYTTHQLIFRPGYSVLALSKTGAEAEELVRRLGVILRYMPSMIQEHKHEEKGWYGRTFELFVDKVVIRHPGQPDGYFDAFCAGQNAGRSFTANLLFIDEWAFQQFARSIWKAIFPTINRPTGGKVIGISTIERGTLFEELFTESPIFNKLFVPWTADPRRTIEWYEATKQALGDDILSEYPSSIEEALTIPGGCYFAHVKGHSHIKEPLIKIPGNYRRYVCIDYGMDRFCACWIWVSEQGHARIYREYCESDLTISEAAEKLKKANDGDKIDLWLAPPDLWNRRQETGKSAFNIFRDNGVTLTETSNNRAAGGEAMNDWFRPITLRDEQTGDSYQTARLTFDEDAAPELWKCITKIQKSPTRKDEYALEPHNLTHSVDALRCFCVYWVRSAKELKPLDTRVVWRKDQWEDYRKANKSDRKIMISLWGKPKH